jgi:hypothetical protein
MSLECNIKHTVISCRRSLRWVLDRCNTPSDLQDCFSTLSQCYEDLRIVESDCVSERNTKLSECPLVGKEKQK